MIRVGGVIGLLSVIATGAAAAAERPIVVELFTSQSCSSCPPAEALLGELRGRADILPLAFHVDYFDRDGWKDVFSLPEATERQEGYARALGQAGPYTPEMVVDGAAGFVGSDRAALTAALRAATPPSASVILTRTADAVTAAIAPGAATIGATGEIALVTFDAVGTTHVGGGENSGRTLTSYNVVRSVRTVGGWSGGAATVTFPLVAGEIGRGVAILIADARRHIIATGELAGATTSATN